MRDREDGTIAIARKTRDNQGTNGMRILDFSERARIIGIANWSIEVGCRINQKSSYV